jgi:hypothetical protein
MAGEVFHITVKDGNGDELEISVWDEQDPKNPKKRELVLVHGDRRPGRRWVHHQQARHQGQGEGPLQVR